MKAKLICAVAFVILCLVGVSIYSTNIPNVEKETDGNFNNLNQKSKFRLLNGSFMGDHATYTFQTPPEEKNYADDCIGCKQEVGNAVIWAEFDCAKNAKYLFESNSKIGVIEKSKKLDKNGVELGERRLVSFKDKDKDKVVGARVFWIEGNDFWAVQAPTIELTKELEESEEYYKVRKKVAEEKENYVPIQNANTERIKANKAKECNEK